MTLPDSSTTVDDLKQLVRRFVEQRDWQQFHAPKNLSMSLAIEAAELMEHFQWLSVDDSRQLTPDDGNWQAVADELADVVCYALALANEMEIDLSTAVRHKMVRNEQKYPADEFRGKYRSDPQA